MKRRLHMPMTNRGVTLVELIVVIVLLGVISAGMVSFIQPSTAAYNAVKARADMMDQAHTAVRRMVQDIQRAVPNSIRSATSNCFELIPASAGGRYRMAPDTDRDAPGCTPSDTCSAPLDTTGPTTVFDSLSTLGQVPSAGDWVVINNQNGNDVYDGVNRAAITDIKTYSASAPSTAPTLEQGAHRITIASTQFSSGYDGGRFLVIPNNQQAVFYVCSGVGTSSTGDGTGTLYRLKAYGFNPAYPSGSCPSTAGGDVVATRIKSCKFVYDPAQGATQQSGFVSLQLEVQRDNETVKLSAGAHVSNVP